MKDERKAESGEPKAEAIVGYRLKRPDCGNQWLYVGSTPGEVASALASELEGDDGLPADERDAIVIEAFETTQEEIDALPEFEGW